MAGNRVTDGAGCAALAFLSVTFNLDATYARAAALRRDGMGYTAAVWRDSPTVAAIRRLPEPVGLYSEGWDAIRFLAERRAASLPWLVLPGLGEPNPDYARQVEELCRRLEEGSAALIFFDQVDQRANLPTEAEVVGACGAPLLARLADGAIYGRAELLPPAERAATP